LADWVAKRRTEKYVTDKDFILMGDFNIPADDDELFAAITSKGLRMPEAMRGQHGSNLMRDKHYDQILHYPSETNTFTDYGGILDFYKRSHRPLFPGIAMTKREFTYQMSDHLPLWVQLRTDVEDERLDQILNR